MNTIKLTGVEVRGHRIFILRKGYSDVEYTLQSAQALLPMWRMDPCYFGMSKAFLDKFEEAIKEVEARIS